MFVSGFQSATAPRQVSPPAAKPTSLQPSQRVNPFQQSQSAQQTRFGQTNPFMAAQQAQQKAFENRYNQMNAQAMARHHHVVSHEQAHAAKAGSFGGGIHLDYKTIQVPMGQGKTRTIRYAASGHVPVSFPSVNIPKQPTQAHIGELSKAQRGFQQILAAATAPQDMSGADAGVAATASAMANKMGELISQAYKRHATPHNGSRLNAIV